MGKDFFGKNKKRKIKKMKMKKIVAASAAAVLAFTGAFSMSVYAADTEDIIVLGDSIAEGYKANTGFASIIDALDGASVTNKGLFGTSSSELADSVKNVDFSNADSVIISVGANDYLDILVDVFDDYYVKGDTVAELKEKLKADSANVITKLSNVTAATDPAITNITNTVATIKSANADADIYVLDLYNPFESLASDETLGMVSSYAGSVMSTFNTKLGMIDGVEVINVADAFTGKILDLTNFPADISKVTSREDADVHPNDAGHKVIADLIMEKIELPKAEVTTTTPVTTTEATTTTTEATTVTTVTTTLDTTTAATTTTKAGTTTTSAATTTKATTTTTKAKTSNSPATSDKGVGAIAFAGVMSIAAICATAFKKKD